MSSRPRRSRSRSPLPQCTNSASSSINQNRLSSLKANNYALVPLKDPSREDPASFNTDQLCWIRDNEPRRFKRFDFIHLSNKTIHRVVLRKKESQPITDFPHQVKRNINSFREYSRSSKAAKSKKWEEEDLLLLQSEVISSDGGDCFMPRCFCHTRNTIIDGILNKDDIEPVQVGFDSLVRVSLRNKADLLSDHLKGNMVNPKMLRDVLNREGFLRENSRDAKSKPLCFLNTTVSRADTDDTSNTEAMLRYSFSAPQCDGKIEEGQIICKACMDIRHVHRWKCKTRGLQENSESQYKIGHHHSQTMSSPSKMKECFQHNQLKKKRIDRRKIISVRIRIAE